MNRRSASERERKFRKGDRVVALGRAGVVALDQSPRDPLVAVLLEGTGAKPTWLPPDKILLRAVAHRGGAPRALEGEEEAESVGRTRACSICGEDHGGDGHPYERDDDEERAARRAVYRPRRLS